MRHELNDEPALSEAGAAGLAFQLHHLGLIVGEEGSAARQSNRVEEPHDGPHFRHVCPAPGQDDGEGTRRPWAAGRKHSRNGVEGPWTTGLRLMLFRLKDRVDDRLRTILLMCVRFSLSAKASGRKKLTPWTVRARKSS